MADYDDETFIAFDDDVDTVISRGAFQLHSAGMVNSCEEGTPGLVSDEYLNAITAETTTTAAELCMAGLWERVEGGYRILDPMMSDVVAMRDRMARRAAECDAHGHKGDATGSFCERCAAPLEE